MLGQSFVAVELLAWGNLDMSTANAQMLPSGSQKIIKGSNKQQVYYASHAMQTFLLGEYI